MNPTLKKISICYVGVTIIMMTLMKLGVPVIGLLKPMIGAPLLVIGTLTIIAALREG